MNTEAKIVIFLLFLSPILAELVTGNAPPLVFFNPVYFLFLLLLYGCGVLLIREVKVRWKLQWSVVFLAVAYGIIEEGLATKAFFNPMHNGGEVLSGYGMYFGVQWIWAISTTLFHTTISTLIPIVMAGLLWPKYKDKPILNKKWIFVFAGFIIAVLFGMLAFPYYPKPVLLICSFIVVVLLVLFSYKYKNSKISAGKYLFSPFIFGVFGFIFQLLNLFASSVLAGLNVSALITLFIQFLLIILLLLFIKYQIYSRNITKRHIVALIFGSIIFYIILAPFNELSGKLGMLLVGIISLILLIIWSKKVLRKKEGK